MSNSKTTPRDFIDLWMKYAWNYQTVDFNLPLFKGHAPQILGAFPDNEQAHYLDKWDKLSSLHQSGTIGLLFFWHEISKEDQDLLIMWLISHYKG